MKCAVISKYVQDEHRVYHTKCKDDENIYKLTANGYTKALLTVEASNTREFIELIIDAPQLFFCHHCHDYMFDHVEWFPSDLWNFIMDTDTWPKCSYVLHDIHTTDGNSSISLYAHKLIATVSPLQEPPKKKRRTFFYESDD